MEQQLTGLDMGTSRVVVARGAAPDYRYETQLNAFVTIPFTKLAGDMLRKEKVAHAVGGNELIVIGDNAERFAEIFRVEARRPMTRGILNPEEGRNLLVIRQFVEAMLGRAKKEGQKLYFSVPAPGLDGDEGISYHEASMRQILGEFGYDARGIVEGLAIVYAELESTNYTGLSISCGGGMCNVCLAYLSAPVVSFSVPIGGDFIDANAAGATRELANHVRIQKETNFRLNGYSENRIEQALNVYYDEMIRTLVGELKRGFAGGRPLPRMAKAIPLVLAGGSAMPGGFQERFEKTLRTVEFPIELSEIRTAANPLVSTAKGALVAALSER
jgi:hypothetical protein